MQNEFQSAQPFGSDPAAAEPQVAVATAQKPQDDFYDSLDYASLPPERQQAISKIAAQTDISKTDTIMNFGNKAQMNVSTFSATTLKNVRTVDLGPVGEQIADVVAQIEDFNAKSKAKPGLFSNAKKHLRKITAEYENADKSVTKITNQLQQHQATLTTDVKMFDKLYDLNLQYFRELTSYIIAGKQKLEQERTTTLVQLREKAQASGLPEDAQAANDFASLCDQFEKKVHDLELTRMVSMQMAPQIRMIQYNDVIMSQKIQSTLVTAIPLWQNQMIITLGLEHSKNAMQAEKAVTDLINDMLVSNAEMLHQGTVEIAKESERGVIDIETLVKVNDELIATLDEVRQIQIDGKQQRSQAESELQRLETELGQKILESSNG